MRIRISWATGQIEGELAQAATAEAVHAALPCSAEANTWGDEVYFSLDVPASLEPGASQVVDPGTICYWIEGRSLALPFGPTPISRGDECRLAAVVNVIGRLDGDPKVLGTVRDGDQVRVESAEGPEASEPTGPRKNRPRGEAPRGLHPPRGDLIPARCSTSGWPSGTW